MATSAAIDHYANNMKRMTTVLKKRYDERHDRKDISHEDHIHNAIEHLHAAGWHEMAEQLEQELHQHMENQRQHDDHSFNSQMRQLMEGVEHRFNVVLEHMEHMERAFEDPSHRMESLGIDLWNQEVC